MKLAAKNVGVFLRLLALTAVIGTLVWELIERVLGLLEVTLDLSVGPIGFDIEVVSLYMMANPGTLLGVPVAILLFRRL